MIRKAFVMQVYPDKHQEYEQRHSPIWPELEDCLRQHGAQNYSIFLDASTNTLFGYVEIQSEEMWAKVASTDVCKRWWKSMAPLMPSNPDNSPVSRGLRPVFFMA